MVQLINEVGATICYTAPTFYRQMAPFARQHGVPELRICVSAGEGLPDATRQLWKDATGIEMLDGIGATEMFHIFISSRRRRRAPRRHRQGRAGLHAPKWSTTTGDEVPRGTIGRLAVIGPTGCSYLDDARQAQLREGRLELPRRRLHAGRRRLLLLPGARRRHDHHRRLQRGAARRSRTRCSSTRRWPNAAWSACPTRSAAWSSRPSCVLKPGQTGDAAHGQDAAGPCQGHARAVQVPAPDRVSWPSLPRTETGKLQRFKLRQP